MARRFYFRRVRPGELPFPPPAATLNAGAATAASCINSDVKFVVVLANAKLISLCAPGSARRARMSTASERRGPTTDDRRRPSTTSMGKKNGRVAKGCGRLRDHVPFADVLCPAKRQDRPGERASLSPPPPPPPLRASSSLRRTTTGSSNCLACPINFKKMMRSSILGGAN